MEIKDILKSRREELKITMKDLSIKVGVSESTISRWESGDIANMKRDKIVLLANALQIKPSVIMGWNEDKHNTSLLIPVYKIISMNGSKIGGKISKYEEIGEHLSIEGNIFGYEMADDSMTPRIYAGDTIICIQSSNVDSGDTVIGILDKKTLVCKKLMIYGNTRILRSTNPKYEDIDITNRKDFIIVGKAIEFHALL